MFPEPRCTDGAGSKIDNANRSLVGSAKERRTARRFGIEGEWFLLAAEGAMSARDFGLRLHL